MNTYDIEHTPHDIEHTSHDIQHSLQYINTHYNIFNIKDLDNLTLQNLDYA